MNMWKELFLQNMSCDSCLKFIELCRMHLGLSGLGRTAETWTWRGGCQWPALLFLLLPQLLLVGLGLVSVLSVTPRKFTECLLFVLQDTAGVFSQA